MPYTFSTQQREGKKKYCMTTIKTGKTYCYNTLKARKKGEKMHEIYAHA